MIAVASRPKRGSHKSILPNRFSVPVALAAVVTCLANWKAYGR